MADNQPDTTQNDVENSKIRTLELQKNMELSVMLSTLGHDTCGLQLGRKAEKLI